MRLLLVGAVLAPHCAWAQMQPHRAEYALRMGAATNASRIGTAMQDITLDCTGWRIKRDVASEVALTASWKVSFSSKLEGEEQPSGNGFQYRIVQTENGNRRESQGRVARTDGDTRAEIVSAAGPAQRSLPLATLMPVAAMSHLVERLRTKPAAFPTFIYAAEAMGDAFRVDVRALDPAALRPAPRTANIIAVPAAQFWPVLMTFRRDGTADQKPLFSMSAKIFESGVLDRVTVDAGIVTLAADLQTLEMHKKPTCPESKHPVGD